MEPSARKPFEGLEGYRAWVRLDRYTRFVLDSYGMPFTVLKPGDFEDTDLSKDFGGRRAVDNISFAIEP